MTVEENTEPRRREVGRYAPSPTGALHLGNLRTAIAAWASVRSRGGRFLLRIEDLDRDRCSRQFEARQLADLERIGLTWDEAPIRQSERREVYAKALDRLALARMAYPCFCSRRDIAAALSAPHGDGGNAYPGTCAGLPWEVAQERISRGERHSWRMRIDTAPAQLFDGFMGPVETNLAFDGGDFVIRRADGYFAYQLVCAVDDAMTGMTEVLRGGDLLISGARQAHVIAALGLSVPRYLHLPLLYRADGERLAKRIGSEDLEAMESQGYSPAAVRSYLAYTLGLAELGEPVSMDEVARRWDLHRIPRGEVRVMPHELEAFRDV